MRTGADTARTLASAFLASLEADAWTMFGDRVRRAFLDRIIMDHIRIADDDSPTTPREILELRDQVEKALHDGVARGRRRVHGLRLDGARKGGAP